MMKIICFLTLQFSVMLNGFSFDSISVYQLNHNNFHIDSIGVINLNEEIRFLSIYNDKYFGVVTTRNQIELFALKNLEHRNKKKIKARFPSDTITSIDFNTEFNEIVYGTGGGAIFQIRMDKKKPLGLMYSGSPIKQLLVDSMGDIIFLSPLYSGDSLCIVSYTKAINLDTDNYYDIKYSIDQYRPTSILSSSFLMFKEGSAILSPKSFGVLGRVDNKTLGYYLIDRLISPSSSFSKQVYHDIIGYAFFDEKKILILQKDGTLLQWTIQGKKIDNNWQLGISGEIKFFSNSNLLFVDTGKEVVVFNYWEEMFVEKLRFEYPKGYKKFKVSDNGEFLIFY